MKLDIACARFLFFLGGLLPNKVRAEAARSRRIHGWLQPAQYTRYADTGDRKYALRIRFSTRLRSQQSSSSFFSDTVYANPQEMQIKSVPTCKHDPTPVDFHLLATYCGPGVGLDSVVRSPNPTSCQLCTKPSLPIPVPFRAKFTSIIHSVLSHSLPPLPPPPKKK